MSVDVRFIAITQRDIDAMVSRGEFRQDLFYRLAGLRIHVPPLRERIEDICFLISHFLREILGHVVRIAPRARVKLEAHPWPGNVRELQTVARRLALELGSSSRIVQPSLVDEVLAVDRPLASREIIPSQLLATHKYPKLRRALEMAELQSLWNRHQGDMEAMAAELQTTVRSIYRRFERLGLKPKEFRQTLSEKEKPG